MTQCDQRLKILGGYAYCVKDLGHNGLCVTCDGLDFGADKMTLSQQLKQLRLDARHSVEEAAKLMGIHGVISNYIEQENIEVIGVLNKYAKLYKVKFIIDENGVEVVNE